MWMFWFDFLKEKVIPICFLSIITSGFYLFQPVLVEVLKARCSYRLYVTRQPCSRQTPYSFTTRKVLRLSNHFIRNKEICWWERHYCPNHETSLNEIVQIINHMKIQCWNTKLGKQASQILLDINIFERMGEVWKIVSTLVA